MELIKEPMIRSEPEINHTTDQYNPEPLRSLEHWRSFLGDAEEAQGEEQEKESTN